MGVLKALLTSLSFSLLLSAFRSTPAVGRFNDDSTPDIFVSFQHGPGFPVYYYSHVHVLDGRDGKDLLEKPMEMLVGTQSSPLTVATEGSHDLFLFWYSSCYNISENSTVAKELNMSANQSSLASQKQSLQFKVLPGTNVHETSRADFCGLRFNATLFTRFLALSPKSVTPLYSSEESGELERRQKINYTELTHRWLEKHPRAVVSNEDYFFDDKALPTASANSQVDSNQFFDEPSNPPSSYVPYQASYQPKRRRRPPSFDKRFGPSIRRPLPKSPNDEDESEFEGRRRRFSRSKRHVGMHDGEGIQRVISTGTLAPSLQAFASSDASIDVLFATYWFPASSNVKLMSENMRSCIDKLMNMDMEARVRLVSPLRDGMDHDAYQEAVSDMCVKVTDEAKLSSFQKYNLFGKRMGAMTIYRKSLACKASSSSSRVRIRPFEQQPWPAYMGRHANSFAYPSFPQSTAKT